MDKTIFLLDRSSFNKTAIEEMVNNPEIYGETLVDLVLCLKQKVKEFNFTSVQELFDFVLKLS